MLTSLLDSHPDISCAFDSAKGVAEAADVGVFHFHNFQWKWRKKPLIFVRRDIFWGVISELVSPHGERANEEYEFSQDTVQLRYNRRQLYTNLMAHNADLVLEYEDITDNGQEITEWSNPDLCTLLGIEDRVFTTQQKKLKKMQPKNLEALRGGTIL